MSGSPHIYTAPDGRKAPCWCNWSIDHGTPNAASAEGGPR